MKQFLLDALRQGQWNPWWYGVVFFAFVGIISLFHINSYVADKKGLNKHFLIGGIISLLIALFFLWKTAMTSTGQPG